MDFQVLKTDEEYLEGIRRNDDEALKVVYHLNFPMVLNLILNNNGTEEEAKDIFQEAMIVFYNNLKNIEFKLDCKIKTYIYSVSRRLWLNELKLKNKFNGNLDDNQNYIEIDEETEETYQTNERKFKVMGESLDELGEPCTTILKDFYVRKYSMTEIADNMGYTNTDNAKNQKYKCLQRLKKIFFKRYK